MEFKKLNKNVRWTRQGYFLIPLQMFMCQGIVLHVDNGPIPSFFGKKTFFLQRPCLLIVGVFFHETPVLEGNSFNSQNWLLYLYQL